MPTEKPNNVSYLEILNIIGSLSSIIALFIVICPKYNLSNPIAYYIIAFLIMIGLLGCIFQKLINWYNEIATKYQFKLLTRTFYITVGILISALMIPLAYYFSFEVIKFIVDIIESIIKSIA